MRIKSKHELSPKDIKFSQLLNSKHTLFGHNMKAAVKISKNQISNRKQTSSVPVTITMT